MICGGKIFLVNLGDSHFFAVYRCSYSNNAAFIMRRISIYVKLSELEKGYYLTFM